MLDIYVSAVFSYGVQAEKFEQAMDYAGKILGFDCQRPDKMIRKGPDNLWKVGHDKYIMIECKSEMKDTSTTFS